MYTFENEITKFIQYKGILERKYTLPVEEVFWDDLEDVLELPPFLPSATNI